MLCKTGTTLKRIMLADGKDPNDWDSFHAGMIAGYAEVSPDIYVRTHLSKLKQGSGSVRTYYEEFTVGRFPNWETLP